MRGARWQVASAEVLPELAGHFPALMARIMAGRGIRTLETAELFLAGDARLSHDPMLLPDIQPAMSRIYRAILSRRAHRRLRRLRHRWHHRHGAHGHRA